MKIIDRSSTVPLYIQLSEILIEKIQDLDIGSQIDTEREICEKYNVSRTTTRLALDELANDEYITKVHGKGNFVANKYIEQKLIEFYSFSEEMRRLKKTPKSQYISVKVQYADNKITKKLNVTSGDRVYCIKRLRLGDDIPMMIETTYLPYNMFKGMSQDVLETNSLYDLMRKDYGVNFDYAEQIFRPILINKEESILLDTNVGMPALKIERYTYGKENLGNRIVEYSIGVARGDVFKYRICLENKNNIKK